MTKQDITDGWAPDGQTFIHFGQGYRLKKNLTQVCIGLVGQDGEPLTTPKPAPTIIKESKGAVTPSKGVSVDGLGDVRVAVTAKIRELSGQGESTRQISEALKAEGVFISHMTVARRLQGALF